MKRYIIYLILCLPILGMGKNWLLEANTNTKCSTEYTEKSTVIYSDIDNSYNTTKDNACIDDNINNQPSNTININVVSKKDVNAIVPRPTLHSITNNCGSTKLTRNDPPSGITWYWNSVPLQPLGGVTLSSAKSIHLTSGTKYYLLARNNTTKQWSLPLTINYTVRSRPSTPSGPSVSNNCGSSTLTRGNPPSGITWYWQSSSTGTSRSNSAKTIVRTSGSTYYLRARNNTNGCWSAVRTVNYSIKEVPNTPTATVTNNCGSVTLTQSPHLINLETWYWQSSPTGTSTSNSSTSITRTSGSTYYLRARKNATGCWSAVRTINYSINTTPAIPTATVSNNCGSSTLTRGNPPVGVTWYWQDSVTGTSTSNSSTSITRTSGSSYYLRARNNAAGCWSAVKTVNYSIQATPAVPLIQSVSNSCGSSSIIRKTPPSGETWYWQSTSTGTSTSNSATSVSLTSGNVHYLRAKNNTSGCWGPAKTINYAIKSKPAKPTISSITNHCGKTVLTRNDPPTGVTWYWNSVPLQPLENVSLSSAKTNERLEGTVYYLLAKNNTTGCWSDALQIDYSITYPPVEPDAPTVINNCGSSTLTRGTPPGGVTWYWQNTETATDTTNATQSITLTSGSTYYLRAKNDNTNCWSTARAVTYSVKSVPPIPVLQSITNECGQTVLKQNPHLVRYKWYWQSTPTATNTTNESQTIIRTDGTVYYLRSYDTQNGCWSDALQIDYTVNQIPAIPEPPTIQKNCGNTVVTINNSSGDIIYYWQDGPADTVTTNAATTITHTISGTKYLRGLSNAGCWGVARRVDYTVDQPVAWYGDGDLDGFGDPADVKMDCNQPAGYVANNNDRCPGEEGQKQGCINTPYDALTFSNENYIYTQVYQKAMTTPQGIQYNKDIIESITYFDGIGRPMQQSAIRASKDEKDIVTHTVYDQYGRQGKEYLPFEYDKAYGSYQTVDVTNTINSYYKNTYADDFTGVVAENVNAYSESIFEPSPLNRVLEQGAPGNAWKANPDSDSDHTIKFDWKTNTAGEVPYFYISFAGNDTESPQLQKANTAYIAGQLYISIIKDENWQPGQTYTDDHTTKEYKDKLGRVILKRTYNQGVAHDTHYVYDDFGNLTYVIPPKVTTSDGVSTTELNELCYQYKYDYRNRLVEKKIPGKGWEYIIYNGYDQPILTQDSNQKTLGEWLFTKYDVYGRVAYTGKITDNRTRTVIQEEAKAYNNKLWVERQAATTIGGTTLYYNDGGYPKVTAAEVLTINYYDTYGFDMAGITTPTTSYGQAITNQTTSLATGTKVKVLDTNSWITTVSWYDAKSRPIYVASINEYLNATDIIESKLDFTGKVEQTTTRHTKGTNATIVMIDTFTYDHTGRLLTQTQSINGGNKEMIVSNEYNALGQLVTKNVGGTIIASEHMTVTPLQQVDYNYNVRGWLKEINDVNSLGNDLFAFGINYNTTTENLSAASLYNGNISETLWKTANDNVKRAYGYQYDALNRITNGNSSDGNYNLSNVTYDKVGNILTLNRKGHLDTNAATFGTMDILSYTYDSGNKLLKVTDTANKTFGFKDGINTNNDFSYDVNGNMTLDQNKGITEITYNHLNLPKTVTINNTSNNGNISYIYDATGAKLKKIVTEGGSLIETEYAGNFVYKNDQLQYFNTPEGYVTPNGSSYRYVYNYKDHLGNIRLSYTKNDAGNLEIISENNYYPFGFKHKGYNNIISSLGNSTAQKYGYNGKELEEDLGLNWHGYGARNYDATIGRWMNIDPLTEKYYDKSSYNYSLNNPVFFVDPDGRTVDVTDLVNGGTESDTWLLVSLMANLSETTGSVIEKSTSRDGVTTLTEGECKSNCKKSNKAGGYVSHLLSDDSGTITVKNNDRNTKQTPDGRQFKQFGSQANPNGEIYLDAMQISNIQYSLKSKDIDPRTMDTGFVFLHESLHTRFGASYFNSERDNREKEGGRFRDPTGVFAKAVFAGPTVDRINKFRSEIGLPLRRSYSNWNPNNPGSLVIEKDGNRVEVPIINYNMLYNE
ncbi:DUF6443 domain-containing protein [Aquimarina sediminis]|uniref:DUF6443 domain-containing protein n=1 Tax=Aquimarina sediminis TaxID=2070536 RepID=UPI0013E8F43D|nr:DUF6443 domain-containing protein [Aquimarina sediminis]